MADVTGGNPWEGAASTRPAKSGNQPWFYVKLRGAVRADVTGAHSPGAALCPKPARGAADGVSINDSSPYFGRAGAL